MATIETLIEGSEKLTCIFGRWPSFHDAEVVDLHLRRGDNTQSNHPRFPVLTTKIHLWELTNEIEARGYYVLRNHTLATLRFHDVLNLEIKGFSHQNVIFGLSVESQELSESPWKRSFAVEFEPVAEFGATFRCSRIEVVEAIPWTQTG
jgi:Immunity protein 50